MTFSNSLQNHFLISMPNLKDHYFQKSITYIIQHDVDGAVGLVVNKPTPRKFDDVFTVANFKNNKRILNLQDKQLLLGGPIYEENCFVLHDSSYQISASHKISTDIFLTTKFDIFDAIAQGSGPKDYLIKDVQVGRLVNLKASWKPIHGLLFLLKRRHFSKSPMNQSLTRL